MWELSENFSMNFHHNVSLGKNLFDFQCGNQIDSQTAKQMAAGVSNVGRQGKKNLFGGTGGRQYPLQITSSSSIGVAVVACAGGGAASMGGATDGSACITSEGFNAVMLEKRLKSPLL